MLYIHKTLPSSWFLNGAWEQAPLSVSFCTAGCLAWGRPGASPHDRALPPQPCAGAGRNVSTGNLLPAQPHWDHSIMDKSALLSSIWTSATQAEAARSPWDVPRSEQWRKEEKPGLFLPLLRLLSEWTNNSTSLACCSEVFLKHQIHTEKINNSPVITHPIAISYPFIYYTPSKRYRARKQIKASVLAHHKLQTSWRFSFALSLTTYKGYQNKQILL